MDRIRIVGGRPLNGSIPISGAKNATLHLLTSTGDYFGPVILAKKGSSTGYVRITTKTKGIGTISKKSGFALAGSGLKKGTDYATAGSVRLRKRSAWAAELDPLSSPILAALPARFTSTWRRRMGSVCSRASGGTAAVVISLPRFWARGAT